MRLLAVGALLALAGCGGRPDARPLDRSPAAGQAASADPSLAADPERGDVLMSWVGDDGGGWRIWFARSSDGGATWSPAVRVTPDTGEVKPHGEASPRLVAGPGGRLAVVWPRDVPVAGRKWPASAIRLARSLDGGRTWLPPVTVNDDTTGAPVGHNFQGAAWAGDSGLVAAWLDERSGRPLAHHHDATATAGDRTNEADATVFLASSPDFGRTWAANRAVWGGACPCCRITMARGRDGGVAAAWRGHFPGNVRDVVTAAVAPRTDSPVRVHDDGWVYPGCPHNGPGLSLGADGRRHVVWYTAANGKTGLYYAVVTGAADAAAGSGSEPVPLVEGTKLPPVHGAVAALPRGGAIAAMDALSDGSRAIAVAHLPRGTRRARPVGVPGSAGGLYPQILTVSDSTALVAYTLEHGDGREVRLAGVTLGDHSSSRAAPKTRPERMAGAATIGGTRPTEGTAARQAGAPKGRVGTRRGGDPALFAGAP